MIGNGQKVEEIGVLPAEERNQQRTTSLGLRDSERRLLLAVVDVLLLIVALVGAMVIGAGLRTSFFGLLGAWKWLVTLAITWFAFASIFDTYNLARAASTTYGVRAASAAAAFASLVYMGIPWLTPVVVNRTQGFLFVGFSILLIVLWRFSYAQLFTQPAFQSRALILGTGPGALALVKALRSDFAQKDANPFRGTGHVLLGYVSDQSSLVGEKLDGLSVLGESKDLVQLTNRLQVDEVILTLPQDSLLRKRVHEALLDCRELGVPVTSMPTVYERLTGRVAVEYVGWDVGAITGYEDKPLKRFYSLFKRFLDIAIGAVGMLLVGVLIPFIVLLNYLTSRGPLFYKQLRVGKSARPFYMFKFRSMIPEAEVLEGAVWADKNDDRVTLAGRWIRRLHLDELPQVYNVMRGEMSLIGPRPERPKFVDILSQELPFYRARHFVRPGITGWAQIHQDYGSSVEDAKVKLEYDLYYIKKTGVYLDMVILLRTITKVVGLKGR